MIKTTREVIIFHSLRTHGPARVLSMYANSAAASFCLSRPAPAYLNVNVQRRFLRRLRSSSGLLPLVGRPYRFAGCVRRHRCSRSVRESRLESRRPIVHPYPRHFDSTFRFSVQDVIGRLTHKKMAHSLRLITYLVPSHPVEMYECIAHFLEEELKVSVTLVYESRDPIDLYNDDRPDPFCLKEVDLGFLSPTQYLKMKRSNKIELLPITPVFAHPKNAAQKPGYFADIIVHTDVGKTVKSFLDLRGCNWGYTGDNSLSSSLTIQKLLRTHGENSSFFGNTIKTGNHLLTVEKVQDKQVIAAAVDSTAFYNYKNVLHKDADDITVLDSVGALPPYAIVCGKYLNGDLKSRIVGALLKAMTTRSWKAQFESFGLIKFMENSNDAYTELEFTEPLDGNGLSSVYY